MKNKKGEIKPKISIIVPVYNVEKYLRECLDSIINQTLREIEIICVDDGSTDSSLKILQEYAALDKRITILEQKNKGAGAARNAAINKACGEFVAFMDSDDLYPSNTTLKTMYNKAVENNVLICGGSVQQIKNDKLVTDPDAFEKGYTFDADGIVLYEDYQFDYGYWRFIYNRQFLKENQLYFPDYLRGQDPPFFVRAMSLAKKFYALKEATYVYRVSYKQVEWTERKVEDILRSFQDILMLCLSHNYYNLQNILQKRLNTNYFKNIIIPFINDKIYELLHKLYELDNNLLTEKYMTAIYNYIGSKFDDRNITESKISVIVPIYNVEKYLAQCLDSIINQTQKNIEIICVNDGSTDGSLEILKQYQAKDKRIIIINQKNLGLSAARNAGIQRSNGDFIVFIDSDDYIAEDMIEKMYQAIIYKNSDVVSCGAECFNDNGIITEALNKKQQWCNRYLYSGYRMVGINIRQEFCPMACCKMYRTDIIRKYQIQFPKGLINEDEYWLWAYMIHCSVTFGIAEKLYFYRQRTDSIMGQRQSNIKILDIIDIHKKIYEVVNQYKNIEVYRNTLSDLFIMHMRDLYKRLPIMYYDQFVHKISVYAEQYTNSEKINEFQRFIETKISVIVPIYNAIAYVRQCLDSLKRQTLHNLEIICVDDGSTDGSLNILKQYAAQDDRFIILSQKNSGSAAARNYGLQKATGDYIGFVDSDDYVSDNYFEKLLECALKNEAEIAATSSVKLFDAYGNKSSKDMGFQGKKIITSVEDKGNIIITTGVSWNKIYLKDFIERNNIKCLELKNAAEDNYFTDTSIMTANKIAVIDNVTYFYRINSNSQTKVLKDKSQFSMTEVYKKIDTFIKNQEETVDIKQQWYKIINQRKLLDFYYFISTMQPEIIKDFKKHFLHEFPDLEKDLPEIIVSLTSYPARIETVNKTIESLLYQSYKADKIVLYLGADKFPKKDKDLPKQLLALRSHLFEIHWVDKDLRSFTKLIPALQEYPDAALVTADDDILYPSEWLERLVTSFINNSDIIHAHRVHKILFKQKKIASYKDWQFCISDNSISFNNFLTGVGGVLYPPHCLHKDIFNEEKFMRLCPQADDIWFWAMAVKNNTCIKVVKNNISKLNSVEGTQEQALWYTNVNEGKNDIQLNNILKEYPEILDKLDKLIYQQNLKLPNKSITYYKLFNFIPIYTYKKREENQVWKILGLPVWRKRKFSDSKTIKYYILGFPIAEICDKYENKKAG